MRYAMAHFLLRALSLQGISDTISDPFRRFGFIYKQPFGMTGDTPCDVKTINWVIPDFTIGSGGHLNIFRIVKKLEEKGFNCRINIDGPTHFSSSAAARECIQQHFFPIAAEVSIGREALQPAAATFATSWTTAYTVRDFVASGKKYYFVQDFEPYFYAHGSEYCFAEDTYRFGFKAITAGNWLAEKLAQEYDMETLPFRFSYDRELYKPHPRTSETKRVFFYARPVTPRRAFELGLLTLAKLHEKNPHIELVLAGWDVSSYHLPFPYINMGVSPVEKLPEIYSQCDVALVLSFTNLSLLPLEAMACNCAVVSNTGAHVEWLLDNTNTCFSDTNPEALSETILQLLADEERLSTLKAAGKAFAHSTDWNVEAEKIANEITKDLSA